MPPKTAVPYKKPWVAMLIFASESGTIFPSKNACFERSTKTPPKRIRTNSYRGIIPDSILFTLCSRTPMFNIHHNKGRYLSNGKLYLQPINLQGIFTSFSNAHICTINPCPFKIFSPHLSFKEFYMFVVIRSVKLRNYHTPFSAELLMHQRDVLPQSSLHNFSCAFTAALRPLLAVWNAMQKASPMI